MGSRDAAVHVSRDGGSVWVEGQAGIRPGGQPMISGSTTRMRGLSAIAAGCLHAQMMLRKPLERWMTR